MNLDFSNIRFPTPLEDIRVFEAQNPNFGVNVFLLEEEESRYSRSWGLQTNYSLHILHRSTNHLEGVTIANLLLIQPMEEGAHYLAVGDLTHFLNTVRGMDSRFKKRKPARVDGYCDRCFLPMKQWKDHAKSCKQPDNQFIVMPDEERNVLKFKDYFMRLPAAYIGFLDLECMMASPGEFTSFHLFPLYS